MTRTVLVSFVVGLLLTCLIFTVFFLEARSVAATWEEVDSYIISSESRYARSGGIYDVSISYLDPNGKVDAVAFGVNIEFTGRLIPGQKLRVFRDPNDFTIAACCPRQQMDKMRASILSMLVISAMLTIVIIWQCMPSGHPKDVSS